MKMKPGTINFGCPAAHPFGRECPSPAAKTPDLQDFPSKCLKSINYSEPAAFFLVRNAAFRVRNGSSWVRNAAFRVRNGLS